MEAIYNIHNMMDKMYAAVQAEMLVTTARKQNEVVSSPVVRTITSFIILIFKNEAKF